MADLLKTANNSKTKFRKRHNNTFGLMYGLPANGGTCPGATTGPGGCMHAFPRKDGTPGVRKTCYMDGIARAYPSVGPSLQYNTQILQKLDHDGMVEKLTEMVQNFVDNDAGDFPFFRLHYSGDFFSEEYARAWVTTVKKFPDVHFWAYTRSFSVTPLFIGLENFTLFLSVDAVNYKQGKAMYERFKEHPNIAMAWMGGKAPEQERWVVCPETSGRIKNLPERGACAKCRLCIDNFTTKVKNIQFQLH